MKHQLHVLVRPPDLLVQELLAATPLQPGVRVEVIDLNGVDPDYGRLVEQIFAADSVVTW